MEHVFIHPDSVLVVFFGVIQDTELSLRIYYFSKVAKQITGNDRDRTRYGLCPHTSGCLSGYLGY